MEMARPTTGEAAEMGPAWSPDGSRIAFCADRDGDQEIYAMDASGQKVTQLTDNNRDDFAPSWSPDGRHIAFTSDHDGNSEIWVMKALSLIHI